MTDYAVWSGADSLDIPIRPTPLDNAGKLKPDEWATVLWDTDPSPSVTTYVTQYATVEWPDAPQVHIADAPVTLNHDKITDSYLPTSARAFINRAPDDTAPPILSTGVFSRSLESNGATYSVIQFGKGTASNAQVMVEVVRTYDWQTPGIRDDRDRNATDGYATTDCIIGSELSYLPYDGLPGHEDPEGKSGKILAGTAFDGVQTAADLATVQNTVGGLLPPAHVRDTRAGPILPVLDAAPTTGPDDLDVAWYRPDGRQTAWPVKAVGYRCQWPANPPKIVLSSELGSEIGGQAVLAAARYVNPAVYHQPNTAVAGLQPELRARAAGRLQPGQLGAGAVRAAHGSEEPRHRPGEDAPPTPCSSSGTPMQDNRLQMRVYSVVLTQTVQSITGYTTADGTISPADGAAADAAPSHSAAAGGTATTPERRRRRSSSRSGAACWRAMGRPPSPSKRSAPPVSPQRRSRSRTTGPS